jgi:hypothetical protein
MYIYIYVYTYKGWVGLMVIRGEMVVRWQALGGGLEGKR